MQCVSAELPAGELEWTAQGLLVSPPGHHASAGHSAHAPPSGPKKPATHLQSVGTELPASDDAKAGQAVRAP